MKRLMLSTTILAATAFGAAAQDNGMFHPGLDTGEFYASKFIGMNIYSSEPMDANSVNGVQQNWDNIGEVSDVILSQEGKIDAVIVDVGGFLGIGEHTVALDTSAIKFVADDSTENVTTDYFLVVNATKDQLEAAPEFDKSQEAYVDTNQPVGDASANTDVAATDATKPAADANGNTDMAATDDATKPATGEDANGANTDVAAAGGATAPATGAEATDGDQKSDTAMADDSAMPKSGADNGNAEVAGADQSAQPQTGDKASGSDMAAADQTDQNYTDVPADMVTAENLKGATVYDSSGDEIGEVSEVLVDDSGKPAQAVVDVGGVLGIGEKPVALPLDQLAIEQQKDSDEIRVRIAQTKEELKAMPEYQG